MKQRGYKYFCDKQMLTINNITESHELYVYIAT